jgi:glycosyltransferase involved in cell wall biosynthesis
MSECTVPFLIDISRLLRRLRKGKLPTGIDRVALAYVEQYGPRSRAFVRFGCFHAVLSRRHSQTLFRQLLHNPPDFRCQVLRSVISGILASIRPPGLEGAILFNVGHSGLEDRRYADLLRRMNVRPVLTVHDLIPITHPEFCRPGERKKHISRMRTVLELARGIITDSQATLDELAAFAEAENMPLPPSIPVFLASHNIRAVAGNPPSDRPYFVVLGTIEPRKNHLLLLHVWRRLVEQMGDQTPLLVIIGQRGWECENVIDILERCEMLRGHVLERSSCTDAELADWLRHSRALLFPSFVEGFGLPLVEAMELGVPVIASNLAVFREIAGDMPDYLDPLDAMGWMGMIVEYAVPESRARNSQLRRMSGFVAPTWENHFRQVDGLLEQVMRSCVQKICRR